MEPLQAGQVYGQETIRAWLGHSEDDSAVFGDIGMPTLAGQQVFNVCLAGGPMWEMEGVAAVLVPRFAE